MRIAVLGGGAMGALYGGYLSRKNDVTIVDVNTALIEKVKADGLKIAEPDGSSAVEMQDPKLHCVVTQYEDGWKNVRVYPYPAYTDEMGAAHGNFTLTREYIESVLYSSIDEQFITLD